MRRVNLVDIKVSDLSGLALDWAVAKAIGEPSTHGKGSNGLVVMTQDYQTVGFATYEWAVFSPSTNWSQGGPLIEKHKVVIVYHNSPDGTPMASTRDRSPAFESGETVLIAGMRAIVAAKLGDTVDVPEELLDAA